jgi:sugar/nucleoside kinase (ribokinase family)
VLAGLPGAALEGRTHIHLAGYFNCTALKPELPGLLKLIRDKHPAVTISLDTNYDSTETWNVDALLPYIDIFMPNEDEAMLISRTSSINEAGLALAERVKVAVIITCGKAGTKIFRRDPAGSVRCAWAKPPGCPAAP